MGRGGGWERKKGGARFLSWWINNRISTQVKSWKNKRVFSPGGWRVLGQLSWMFAREQTVELFSKGDYRGALLGNTVWYGKCFYTTILGKLKTPCDTVEVFTHKVCIMEFSENKDTVWYENSLYTGLLYWHSHTLKTLYDMRSVFTHVCILLFPKNKDKQNNELYFQTVMNWALKGRSGETWAQLGGRSWGLE